MMYDYKLHLAIRTPRACPWEQSGERLQTFYQAENAYDCSIINLLTLKNNKRSKKSMITTTTLITAAILGVPVMGGIFASAKISERRKTV